MSEIMLNVCDARLAVHQTIHASQVDLLVAALSADPETIEELQAALRRFLPDSRANSYFAGWRRGTNVEPWDAGFCLIDLTARLVVVQSTYSKPGRRGRVSVLDESTAEDPTVPYHLAADWLFLGEGQDWEAVAEHRQRQRLAEPAVDARAVLYGKLCDFLVQAATTEGAPETISAIHARWLTTPRTDLGGVQPRDVLLSRRDHISSDLEDRAQQWSRFGVCPPGLAPETAAFRLGGFGTHEIVLYYDLVRFLLYVLLESKERTEDGPKRLSGAATTDFVAEVRRLEALRDEWLEAPNREDLHGRTPASVIARERARLPEGVTGAEAVIDHDCPMCQMMADFPGPMFWNLDGCNMEDDFAFSFHRTRQEWEAERQEWEEFNRRFEEERRSRPMAEADLVWQSSHTNEEALGQSPGLALFGLGAHLGELIQDLRDAGAGQDLVDQLNRAFSNVRAAVESPASALVEPVIEKMCETLDSVVAFRPVLADKCAYLQRQLSALARRLSDEPPWDEELPF